MCLFRYLWGLGSLFVSSPFQRNVRYTTALHSRHTVKGSRELAHTVDWREGCPAVFGTVRTAQNICGSWGLLVQVCSFIRFLQRLLRRSRGSSSTVCHRLYSSDHLRTQGSVSFQGSHRELQNVKKWHYGFCCGRNTASTLGLRHILTIITFLSDNFGIGIRPDPFLVEKVAGPPD